MTDPVSKIVLIVKWQAVMNLVQCWKRRIGVFLWAIPLTNKICDVKEIAVGFIERGCCTMEGIDFSQYGLGNDHLAILSDFSRDAIQGK